MNKSKKNNILNQFLFNINKSYDIKNILYATYNFFLNSDLFYGHGTNNAWDESLYLILPILGLPLNSSRKVLNYKVNKNIKKILIKKIIKRAIKKIPVSYLTNKSWFCNHEFYVNQNVLIPRSPISEVINKKFFIHYEPISILDMCTGSGCIAISCAYIFPKSKIDAVDISINAIKIAHKNIKMHNMKNNINLIHSNLFEKIKNKKYDIIVSNPPYVKFNKIKKLPKEYLYEPNIGLNSGNSGIEIIKKIIFNSQKNLTNRGLLVCEVGNNEYILRKKFNYLPFKWIKLTKGGKGVFILKKIFNTN